MAKMNKDKVENELEKLNLKLDELQKKIENLKNIKKSIEDTEYLDIIYKNKISAEKLQLMIKKEQEINKNILRERNKTYEENY